MRNFAGLQDLPTKTSPAGNHPKSTIGLNRHRLRARGWRSLV